MNRRAMDDDTRRSPSVNDFIDDPAASVQRTVRLTAAQALVRYLAAQRVATGDGDAPLFGGVFAIFGHGNVAGLGEALHQYRDALPTYRAHNEQAMAHSAIAYAKAHLRRRMMAVTTSIGPGATNLVTAAALAHVNRLPVLLLPGDVFVSRAPDPVLQQIEDFHDGAISANDAFKAVSRYFDRIVHPAQLLTALPRALRVLTDAALCGPVTLALPQDVQTMAYDYPAEFFAPRAVTFHAPAPVEAELDAALAPLRASARPFIVAGGGALYSEGGAAALAAFAERHGIPVGETQAGKSALPWDHPLNAGAIGVTGSPAANALAHDADCVIAVGTRLQDFTTGSNTLFARARVIGINANAFDALKHRATIVQADARLALEALGARLEGWRADAAWTARAHARAGAAVRRRRDRRRAALGARFGRARHRRVRGGHAARRAAQAVARGGAGRLSRRIRLFVHGLRDRGRARREAREARARGDRDGRRRQLSDDEQRDRDVGDARREADRRGARQPRLRLHQPAAAGVRRRAVQQPVRRLRARPARRAAHRFRRARARARRARGARRRYRRARSGDGARPRVRSHVRDLHRHRSRPHDARRRLVVGSRGARSVAARRGARRARGLRAAPRRARGRSRLSFNPLYSGIIDMSAPDIRIGINPLSWMNDDLPSLGGETPLAVALTEGREIGYEGFELGNKFPREPQALKALLAQYDLSLVSGWYSGRLAERGVQEEIDAVGPHLELLAKNGATVMVYGEVAGTIQGSPAPLYQRPRFVDDAQWDAYAERVDAFARYTRAQGVRLGYHHHMGAYVESPADVARLMASTSDAVGLLFDAGHMTFGGGDPVAELAKHIGRVCHVHCKDVRPAVIRLARNRNWSFLDAVIAGAFTVPGDGSIDFPTIVDMLKRHGYRGWLVVEAEQDPAVAPSYAYAQKGYRTLRALVDAPLPPVGHKEAA